MADVSQTLGEFMLKGYVLTDQTCPTPGCAIPMLRTPRGKSPVLTFCVQCNNEIQVPNSTQRTVPEVPPPTSHSSSSHHSPSSTPPTEYSEITNLSAFELPPETDEVRQRREQSDRASSEIGKKLLKGWAMLGEECPSDGCYGVPLVRPPKIGGVLDPRKECVMCGKAFTTEVDWAGRETLVPHVIETDRLVTQPTSGAKTPDTLLHGPPQKKPRLLSPLDPQPSTPTINVANNREPSGSGPDGTLNETSDALQASLEALSSKLRLLSSQSKLDLNSISLTADAISKVTQALGQVRQLQLQR